MRQTRYVASIATQSDLQLVSRLCKRAVGPMDYSIQGLRGAIDKKGLFLAWSHDELVGMTNFNKCFDNSGWLSMARTDPDWRRKGIAVFLQRQIAAYAKERGITALRLWAASTNKPSVNAIRKGGFRLACEAAQITCSLRKRTKHIAPANILVRGKLVRYQNSKYISQMNGYMPYIRCFLKPSGSILKTISRRGEVYRSDESVMIVRKPERRFGKLQSNFTLLEGGITASLRGVKEVATGLGAEIARGYIPYNRYQLRAAKRIGFRQARWGKHCLVFERKLP